MYLTIMSHFSHFILSKCHNHGLSNIGQQRKYRRKRGGENGERRQKGSELKVNERLVRFWKQLGIRGICYGDVCYGNPPFS